MRYLAFASTNQNKYQEVQSVLADRGINVQFVQMVLTEIQSDSLEHIAKEKARSAYTQISKPVIVEDDGLFINSLGGFPGQYSSYVFRTIGNTGILKLLSGVQDRSALFLSLIAFFDGRDIFVFEGRVNGRIALQESVGGWGYDPIFVPEGEDRPYAELKNKNDRSHRRKALDLFAEWYQHS